MLLEAQVQVVCRSADASVVNSASQNAKRRYEADTGKTVQITISSDSYPSTSCGGVQVSTSDGRIKCDQTLETRLQHVGEGMVPEIRLSIFGPSESRKFFD